MIDAKEAKKITNNSSVLDKLLEDIEAAIIGEAEDGGFTISYILDSENVRYKEKLKEILDEKGYTVTSISHTTGSSNFDTHCLKVEWRFA